MRWSREEGYSEVFLERVFGIFIEVTEFKTIIIHKILQVGKNLVNYRTLTCV
jgi:hypothetical protein